MAALSVRNSFYHETSSTPFRRIKPSYSCQSHEPIRFSGPEKKNQDDEKSRKVLSRAYVSVEKLGKRLKDSMSPKSKGDWKDVMLMSISFAVYVYMSQKIVTAYCSWVSMCKP